VEGHGCRFFLIRNRALLIRIFSKQLGDEAFIAPELYVVTVNQPLSPGDSLVIVAVSKALTADE
jgi:hypothetical protein